MMSEMKIVELDKKTEVLEMHLSNQGSLLTNLASSTKELHESVREQQITIIEQSHTINKAVEKMTDAIERQEEANKEMRQTRNYVDSVDKRLLRVEEKLSASDEFWKPIKANVSRVVIGFFLAGVIWASVTAFKGG